MSMATMFEKLVAAHEAVEKASADVRKSRKALDAAEKRKQSAIEAQSELIGDAGALSREDVRRYREWAETRGK